jgi:hypothetical protein
MKGVENYISLHLKIENRRIAKILDLKSKRELKSFFKPLTEDKYKLYVLKRVGTFLYIGITRQSLRSRLHLGFNAEGENGYHGYKWKDLEDVNLFVWTFSEYNKTQLENIEAELAYLIRVKTKRWPLYQNEIHFNNEFETGKDIAEKIFEICLNQNL